MPCITYLCILKNPEQISLEILFKMQPQAQSSMIGKQNMSSQKTGTCPTSAAFWNFVEIPLTISHSVYKNKGRLQYFLLLDNVRNEMSKPLLETKISAEEQPRAFINAISPYAAS